jgi:hypothetical protein
MVVASWRVGDKGSCLENHGGEQHGGRRCGRAVSSRRFAVKSEDPSFAAVDGSRLGEASINSRVAMRIERSMAAILASGTISNKLNSNPASFQKRLWIRITTTSSSFFISHPQRGGFRGSLPAGPCSFNPTPFFRSCPHCVSSGKEPKRSVCFSPTRIEHPGENTQYTPERSGRSVIAATVVIALTVVISLFATVDIA